MKEYKINLLEKVKTNFIHIFIDIKYKEINKF